MDNSKYTIILNAGHGGFDHNGVYTTYPDKMFTHQGSELLHNKQGDFFEGVGNRAICGIITALASIKGYRVINVHDSYKDLTLSTRVARVNREAAKNRSRTILLDIHSNSTRAGDHGKAKGWEIFAYARGGKANVLADLIASEVPELKIPIRYHDKGKEIVVKTAKYRMLKSTLCPAVTIEHGFFDNRDEATLLNDFEHIRMLAESNLRGIENYFKKFPM